MDEHNLLWSILVMAAVTAALRFAPFILFRGGKMPKTVTDLGKTLPYAVMGMLVVYCLKGLSFSALDGWLPALISGAVTVLSYARQRSTLLSIIVGTACYMALIRIV